MKVRNSITSEDEKLTDVQLQDQWNKTNWKKAEEHVNRLQVRITKAVKAGKWYLVKRLQYLITLSHYAKLLAVRKPAQVKERQGLTVKHGHHRKPKWKPLSD